MKVAIVHEWLLNVAGAERVLLELKKIYPEATIFTSVFDPSKAKPFADFEVKTSFLQRLPFMKKKRELLVPFVPLAFEQFDLSKYDLVISISTMGAKGVLTKPNTLHIDYCCTPPRYLWETNLDPRAEKGKLAWLRKKTIHELRIWDKVASDRPDYYIAISNYTASRIKKYYGRDSKVIYPPVGVDRFKSRGEKIGDYFLFVSRLVNYKKADLVIKAFNDLGFPLKIVGKGPDKKILQKMAKSNIEFLGHLSDEELSSVYSRARALIFPAEEDFGIVPLEALACGRPVIAYGVGGAAETIIDGKTGMFFLEQTPECLIDALKNFKSEDYKPEECRKQAERFSSERFRREFREEIEKILEKQKKDKTLITES